MDYNNFGMDPYGGNSAPVRKKSKDPNWITFWLGIGYLVLYLIVNFLEILVGIVALPLLIWLLLPVVFMILALVGCFKWSDTVTCVMAAVCAGLTLIGGAFIGVTTWLCTALAAAAAVFAVCKPVRHAPQQFIQGDQFQSSNSGMDDLGF